ncbi:MAG TPA: glycosyltransferase family 4 protein [Candidatus Polarisedimenticolia bacterium]|nr:glycosyltransferase family 4 protein [Candidatus Polarisedimenticolia bacterium]
MPATETQTPAPAGARQRRLLVVSYDYRPRLGGVATCAYELSRGLSGLPGVTLRLLAPSMPGAEAFDAHGHFETGRRPLPAIAVRAIPPLARWIRAEARRFRPDAVLCLLWHPCGIAARLALPRWSRLGRPQLVMAHGVEVMETRSTLRKRLRGMMAPLKRHVLREAAAVLPVSRYTAGLVIAAGALPGRVHVVHNGVDLLRFSPGPPAPDLAARYGTSGRRVLLTVARLVPHKGMDRALGALARVIRTHPEVLYIIGGEGPDRARLESIASRLGLENHVVFAGPVPPDRLADHYRLADCFLLLTREDRATPNVEGFGLVFLEAAACGKASIAGRSGGIPDAVADGESGWLVDPEDEAAIAAAMTGALDDPAALARMGLRARARAGRDFTWDAVARRVVAALERADRPPAHD